MCFSFVFEKDEWLFLLVRDFTDHKVRQDVGNKGKVLIHFSSSDTNRGKEREKEKMERERRSEGRRERGRENKLLLLVGLVPPSGFMPICTLYKPTAQHHGNKRYF